MAVDDGIISLWAVVIPTGNQDVNLCTNPSFETNTAGWTATSATLTRTAGAGVFGSYGGRLLASAQNGNAAFTCGAVANGSSNVASAWVKATSALVKLRCVIGATTVDQAHPGDGAWHRLSVVVTAPSATTPVASVRDERASAWANVDVDGVMVETGVTSATTYLDGDQDGCSWTGAVHGSTSTRNGRYGGGGSIVSFDTLGLYVTEQQGIGNAPVDVATQQYAYTDGSAYVRSLAKERVMTLICEMLYPTGLIGELHTVRALAVSALNLDKRDGRGPIVLRYGGSSIPRRLTAHYEGGLEMEKVEATTEVAPLRFLVPDSYYYAEIETQANLAAATGITGAGLLAIRDPNSVWSNAAGGSASATPSAVYDAVRANDGRIYVGGLFDNMGGVAAADNLAAWDGVAWSALGGTTPNGAVYTLAPAPNGDIYVGGAFTDLAGIANADRVAVYAPSTNTFAALSTGASNTVYSLVVDPSTGYLWATGLFLTIGGVTSNFIAYWNGSAWVSAASGFPASFTTNPHLTVGPDRRIYCSVKEGVYVWSGTAWSLLAAANADNLIQVITTIGGYLYAAGSFTTIGGVSANRIARWNGTSWAPLGAGASAGTIFTVAGDRSGQIHAAGGAWGTIGGITPPDNIATWNGSIWLPFAANPPDTGTHANDIYKLWTFGDGSLLVGWVAASGTFGTTLSGEANTAVTNSGSASAYPIIDFSVTTTVTIYSIRNLTTGQAIYFNGLTITTGEIATLDLRPGAKTFKSFTRDLRPYVLPGSDLVAFALAPGINTLAVYTNNSSATVTARWRARFWSPD